MTNTAAATCQRCLGPCPAGTTHCQECEETMKLVEHDFQVMTGASLPLSADDPPYFTDEGEPEKEDNTVSALHIVPATPEQPYALYFCGPFHLQQYWDTPRTGTTITQSDTPYLEVPDDATCAYCNEDIFSDEEEDEESEPSALAQDVIEQLKESGDSQAMAVGDCLESIASNGGEQATDDYLAGCAHEIALAAVGAANDLDASTQYSVVNRAELSVLREFLGQVDAANTEFDQLELQAHDLLTTLPCLENV